MSIREDIFVDEYVIGEETYKSTLREDLHIDDSDINGEFIKYPTAYAWYSTAYEQAAAYERFLKDQLAMVYGQLDMQVRTEFEQAAQKATEKKVENTIINRPVYMQVQDQFRLAEKMTGLLKAARDAMLHKKECLISLGANLRQEMKSEPYL